MAKSPSAKEDEDLRGELRSLRKENKSLRRRLGKLERSRHLYEQETLGADEPVEVEEKFEPGIICQGCKRDYLQVLDLVHTKIRFCNTCKFREKVK